MNEGKKMEPENTFYNTTNHRVEHFDFISKIRLQNKGMKVYKGLLFALAVLLIVVGFLNMPDTLGIIYLTCAIVLILFGTAGLKTTNTKKALKKTQIEDTRSYMITDDRIFARSEGESEIQSFAFDEFDDVYVGDDAIYLKFRGNKKHMFLVMDSDGFTNASAEEVLEFLEAKGIKAVWEV